MHRVVVDYLEVYKKWDRIIDVKENNTLDFVAKTALGIQKVKYPGTLQELYESDYDKYVFFCLNRYDIEHDDDEFSYMNHNGILQYKYGNVIILE